jgi:hypothetical protein
MKAKLLTILMIIGFAPAIAQSGYNANISGKVDKILTYSYTDRVLIRLKNQPTSHPECNSSYFSIGHDVSAENRKSMLARAMLSYSQGTSLNIGYDKNGGCSPHSYIKVYRVG